MIGNLIVGVGAPSVWIVTVIVMIIKLERDH